jgi:hypothetical protein
MHQKEGREKLWERESQGFLDDVDRLKKGYSSLNGLEVKLSTYLERSTCAKDTFTPKSGRSVDISAKNLNPTGSSRLFITPRQSYAPSGCCFNTHNNICGSTRATTYSTDSRALQDHRRDSGFEYRQGKIEELEKKAWSIKQENSLLVGRSGVRGVEGGVKGSGGQASGLSGREQRRPDRYMQTPLHTVHQPKIVPPARHRQSMHARYNSSVETNYFGMERNLAGEITQMARGFEDEKEHLLDLIQTQARMIHELQVQQMPGGGRVKSVRFTGLKKEVPSVRSSRETYYAWAG